MIYILEDDNSIRELVVYTLNATGMEAVGFERPAPFWQAMAKEQPELLLLDIMLPDEDGLQILRRLRTAPATRVLPVILLTAKSAEYDKVIGLDSGADDYVAKPFGMMELLSRIRALLRRSEAAEPEQQEEVLTRGALTVLPAKHIVRDGERTVTLTQKEFELLCLLLRSPGTVFSREQLISQVWGYAFTGETRTVDVHIRTLRQKLGDSGERIETVRGYGYKIGE